MLYHVLGIIFSASFILLLTRNHNKLFKFIAIIYPLIGAILLCNTNDNQLFSAFGIHFIMKFGESNKLIAIAFMLVTLVANLYSCSQDRKAEVIIGGVYCGAAIIYLVAGDFISMFLALELMMIAATMLIFINSTRESLRAARQYFLTHFLSSSLILIGISYIITNTGSTEIILLTDLINTGDPAFLIYALMFIGYLINVACFPFSSWLINCYPNSSSSSFLYLITFSTKVSIVTIIKLFTGFEALKFFGIIMILYGGIYACIENNLRRLFCYLIVAQLGVMLIEIGIGSSYSIFGVLSYLPVHILYSTLFGLTLAILLDEAKVIYCSQLARIKNLQLVIALVVAILMMVNFPFTASFMSKLISASSITLDDSYYLVMLLNIMLFIALPLREYFSSSKKLDIKLTMQSYASLYYTLAIAAAVSVFIIREYLSLSAEQIEQIALPLKILKQTLIMTIGIILALTIKIRRRSTISTISLLENYLLLASKGFSVRPFYKNGKSELYIMTRQLIAAKLPRLNNQQTAIFMVFSLLIALILIINNMFTNQGENNMNQPIAEKTPYSYNINDQTINDEYAWLRDKNWPAVKNDKILKYLAAENLHFEQFFLPLVSEKEQIFEELKGRIKLEDQSTYTKKDDYYYYTRTEKDKEYAIYCRKFGSPDAKEEVLLNVNKLAAGKNFTQLGAFTVSPDHKLIAYSVDFAGNEKYNIKVFDLERKEYLVDEIAGVSSSIVWHENIAGFFYAPLDENLRHNKVKFHQLGTGYRQDTLIFHETNQLYQLSVSKSSSRQYLIINSGDHGSNEVYVISMQDTNFSPQLIRKAQDNIFYDIEHNGDYFYIKTNHKAKNFQLVRVNTDRFATASWEEYIPEEQEKYLAGFDITENYLILNYSYNALPLVKVKHLATRKEKIIKFPDEAFDAEAFSTNFAENDIRVSYSSLARPSTIYSYDFTSDRLATLKVQEIPSGFNPAEYMVERIFASNEGVKVPITLFYKKSLFKKNGSNPLYLYGYGSYGIGMPVAFRNSAVSLANRGFVFAIAHIRGGNELGHDWYEAAKFLTKKRTFDDFIKSTEHLIKTGYTSKGNIVICGGSAGGLLIGAVINEKPDLFKAAIVHVPFVDLLNTMLDESLPLTLGEFKEWGNPKDPVYFEYMKSYSPYDNIKPQNYPTLMVTAGLSDPRVGYWEAAKWVARLRATKTDNNTLILKTNMGAGHRGASGRFDFLKEAAEDLVFIFKVFGVIASET